MWWTRFPGSCPRIDVGADHPLIGTWADRVAGAHFRAAVIAVRMTLPA